MVVNEIGTPEKNYFLKKAEKAFSALCMCIRVKLVSANSEDLYCKTRKLMQMSENCSVSVSLCLRTAC